MRFTVQLYIRERPGGTVLARVIAEPELCCFAVELEDAILDLTLLLTDRLRRAHPRRLSELATHSAIELQTFTVDEALRVFVGAGQERLPLEVVALKSRHKSHDRLWFPEWDLRQWVERGAPLGARAEDLLAQHRLRREDSQLLSARKASAHRVHTLELELEPAPLAAFTGRFRDAHELPAPVLREDEDEPAPRPKKKRPATPCLDAAATQLSERARADQLGRAVEMEALVDSLERQLAQDSAAVVLVGPTGCGKTSLVYELAHRRAKSREPDAELWAIDATRLIAMRSMFSDWRSQTLGVVDEIAALGATWFVGPLLPLLDAGKSYQSKDNVAQVLRPALGRRRVRLVGECTAAEWARLRLRDPGFAQLFTPIRVEEPSPERSARILTAVALHRLDTAGRAAPGAIAAAREIATRFGGHASTHPAALALLLRAIEDRLAEAGADPDVTLERRDVVATFCRESGMPPALIQDDVALDLDEVRAQLEERVVGQPHALEHLVDLVSMIKAGLSDPSRPLGSFLFVGPTGVGKTQTAKALAALLFGAESRLVRFDMSELSSADAVSRFIGLGREPGKLVSEIRRTPFCVLLLDEIEKAHPAAFDALLSVLGEARLTDAAGRTGSFRNAIVVMTSNLGVETMRPRLGFGGDSGGWAEHFVAEAKRFFRPELFNRIDHVVAFRPLPEEAIRGIADRELRALASREGLARRGVELDVPPDVRDWLAARGVDPKLGARPLKRTLERELAGPIATRFSGREPSPGVLTTKVDDGRVEFAFEATKRRTSEDRSLRELVDRVGELRYFFSAARRSRAIRDLALSTSRLDRLLANPRFRKGYADLEEAFRRAGPQRALLEDLDAFGARVASLEDLAFEAAYNRDFEALTPLLEERDESVERLAELGLRIRSRAMPSPDRALLLFDGTASNQALLAPVLRAYAALALGRGWSVRGLAVGRRPPTVPSDELEEVVVLESFGSQLRPNSVLKKWCQQFLRDLPMKPLRFAFDIRGEHAGAMLQGERGTIVSHQVGGHTRSVRLSPLPLSEIGKEHEDGEVFDEALRSDERLRTLHFGRDQVTDPQLGLTLALSPRLERLFERLIVARIWDAVFFEGAHRAFAAGVE